MLDRMVKVCVDIVTETNISTLMEHVTEWVGSGMQAEICSLFTRDEVEPEWLVLRAARGYPRYLCNTRTHRLGEGITGQIVEANCTIRLNSPGEVRAYPGHKGVLDKLRQGDCTSLLGCPIVMDNDYVIGTLKVENKQARPGFSIYDEEVLKAVCAVLALRLKKDNIEQQNWRAANIGKFLHEISKPVTSVRWFCQGILKTLRTIDSQKSLADDIRRIYVDAERFRQIIDNADFFTDPRPLPHLRDVDLAKEVAKMLEPYKEYALKQSIEIVEHYPANGCSIQSDPDKVSYIVGNLVQNALKYGKSPVVVRLLLTENEYTFVIEDHGPGVSDEERGRLTEPYFQGEQNRNRKEGGLGLGLSVCEKAVSCLGGKIDFERNSPSGLVVRVTCPRGDTVIVND